MTRLSDRFSVSLQRPEALVVCVDAIDGLGWEVESVEAGHVLCSNREPSGDSSEIELWLTHGRRGTEIRVLAASSGDQDEWRRSEMLIVREAIETAAGTLDSPKAASPAERQKVDPEFEREFRKQLHRLKVKDRRLARIFRILALALLVMSAMVLAEAGVTLLWQEPLSYVYAKHQQSDLESRLHDVEMDYLRALKHRAAKPNPNPAPRLSEEASRFAGSTNPGEPLGRISIPAIGLDSVVVEDTSAASLKKGPAHYEETPLPGQHGTVGIAGHRTTFLAPFHDLDDLDRRDRVVLQMPYGRFTYRIEGTTIVSPEDVQILNQVDHDRLTMTACHPLYSASERIAVFARLVAEQRS